MPSSASLTAPSPPEPFAAPGRGFATGRPPRDLEAVGLDPHASGRLKAAMAAGQGTIMLAGPTGSGKTTTCAAALLALRDPSRLVMTVEGVIEHSLEGIPQACGWAEPGVPYSTWVRAALRHRPDVLLACKPEDLASSTAILDASLGGTLVFSAIHTPDAPSTLARLVDQGVPAWKVAAGLSLVLAQRLARRVCPECRRPATPTRGALEALGVTPDVLSRWGMPATDPAALTLVEGAGCEACGGSGYRGHTVVASALSMSEPLRSALRAGASVRELTRRARAAGMRTLREAALRAAVLGETTLVEVVRVTAPDPEPPPAPAPGG